MVTVFFARTEDLAFYNKHKKCHRHKWVWDHRHRMWPPSKCRVICCLNTSHPTSSLNVKFTLQEGILILTHLPCKYLGQESISSRPLKTNEWNTLVFRRMRMDSAALESWKLLKFIVVIFVWKIDRNFRNCLLIVLICRWKRSMSCWIFYSTTVDRSTISPRQWNLLYLRVWDGINTQISI